MHGGTSIGKNMIDKKSNIIDKEIIPCSTIENAKS